MTPLSNSRQRDTRLDALNHWLSGVLGAHVRASRPLSSDASFRRYFRVRDAGHSWIVMDAPPEREHPADFVRIAGCLEHLGLTVPRVLAADTGAGFLLLEDLGNRTFSRALAGGASEQTLYCLAVDTLVILQKRWLGAGELEPPAPYDEEELLREARLLLEWYWPQVQRKPCPEAVGEAFEQAWRQVLAPAFQLPPVLVLRDFHVDNLMVMPNRQGVAACGLLDFQDALLGSPAYDLVSLLRDARRDVPEALADEMVSRFVQARPELDRATLETAYWVLGAQRNTKIIGIFTRLWQRDGKPVYLRHLPRLWRLLEQELAQPALGPVRAWFDTHLPPPLRRELKA
ncbi:aminoglycoside phosphotransferase [Thioalkalivibrio denitrificans]|uniref:Aminoglycoside phosphotransferase n=1 Tax=Thioalkalivibrio denitrificans TaxID=108003 RepID=A0A1V3NDY8_9GAMM|nr:phosphotransferase [Thioalkalivibrio denitrificans]OOG23280.1 aminoglycoside phosphotransferase [Thioalkalivibrio denitrificans]